MNGKLITQGEFVPKFENKVAKLIREEAEKLNFTDKIEEIIVPTHDITEVRRGKRVQRKKSIFLATY